MLRITLRINSAAPLADYEVVNVCPAKAHGNRYHWCTYDVRLIRYEITMGTLATVRHRRKDGAQRLAAKVLLHLAMKEARDGA